MREGLFRALAISNVADGAHRQRALLGFQRAETDLDWQLRAVLAQPIQFQTRPHGPGARRVEESAPMSRMLPTEAFWNQRLHLFPEEFLAGVAEEFFGLGVNQDDVPFPIDDQNGVRRRFQ